MKIGIISDTHNFLDPKVEEIFAGVDHILHAGDVGRSTILVQLEQIAPVTAVFGNTDDGLPLRETEVIELSGRKFMIHHIVDVHSPSEKVRQKLTTIQPDVLVFGHTHKPFNQIIGKTLFLNPGSAGRKRFNDPRLVALLHCSGDELRVDFKNLE
ncbi:MAG: metallophosphoesterase family protein [Limisphaerales bacterium]